MAFYHRICLDSMDGSSSWHICNASFIYLCYSSFRLCINSVPLSLTLFHCQVHFLHLSMLSIIQTIMNFESLIHYVFFFFWLFESLIHVSLFSLNLFFSGFLQLFIVLFSYFYHTNRVIFVLLFFSQCLISFSLSNQTHPTSENDAQMTKMNESRALIVERNKGKGQKKQLKNGYQSYMTCEFLYQIISLSCEGCQHRV